MIVDVNFDALDSSVSKILTRFDKMVYIAIYALYLHGETTMTATQIYRVWKPNSNPAQTDIAEINASVAKMAFTDVKIDSRPEHKKYKRYKKIVLHKYLLPIDRCELFEEHCNNVDVAIKLLDVPPLMYFAQVRKQVASLPEAVLQAPIRRTKMHLAVGDFLITNIAHMEHPNYHITKITYQKMFERCGLTNKKDKQRAVDTAKRYLAYFADSGLIQGYKAQNDGINVEI